MKRLLIAAALCALAACTNAPAQIPPPSTAAEQTVLDEKGLLGVELAYKTAQRSAEILVDQRIIVPNTPTGNAVRDADTHAYLAVRAARLAYQAGNATDYATATAAALGAVDAFSSALPSTKGN